jgi:hypothetical protein
MTLQQALDYFGGHSELARALGIKPPSVYGWKAVPHLRQAQLQHLTGGKLKADEGVLPARAA